VRQAYRFADEAHLGQMRNSGEPYITHPIAVAAQCADWKLDAQALMAACCTTPWKTAASPRPS
jgi:guanosine-3',5'-bis(diphosphate) 3'-pyrophosphohydrolase